MDSFDRWFPVLFAAVLVYIVIAIPFLFVEIGNCKERGGEMVQGLSWNGYVCVEGK